MKNRGITLVELIISIALISIVIIFLFQLLVDVRYNDNKIDYARENQQTRAIILKTVQDDFLDYGLIGLNSNGSTNNKLIVNFIFKQEKTGVLTVEKNSVVYKKANDETEKWPLDENIGSYNVNSVSYKRIGFEDEGDFFSIWFRIPLTVKKNSNNTIDDLEFFYIGKKIDIANESNIQDSSTLGIR